MTYKPDDHSPSKSRELAFLVEALGIDELYKRVNDLDGKGDLPEAAPFNPTNDPMVKKDETYQVATLSGGPREENVGDLSVIDPDHVKKIKALAEIHQAEADERDADKQSARATEREKVAETRKEAGVPLYNPNTPNENPVDSDGDPVDDDVPVDRDEYVEENDAEEKHSDDGDKTLSDLLNEKK